MRGSQAGICLGKVVKFPYFWTHLVRNVKDSSKSEMWKFSNFPSADPSLASSHWLWPDLDAPGCCWFSYEFILIVLIVLVYLLLLYLYPYTDKGLIECNYVLQLKVGNESEKEMVHCKLSPDKQMLKCSF